MTDDSNTAIDAIQIDEDILTDTVPDEALEAGADMERGAYFTSGGMDPLCWFC